MFFITNPMSTKGYVSGAKMDLTLTVIEAPENVNMLNHTKAFRAEGGYVAIFDLTGPSVIASDPSMDLTQQILTRLQATPVR